MSCVAQQFNLKCFFPSLNSSSSFCNQTKKRVSFSIVNSVAISNAQTQERLKLKQLFREANQRCLNHPMDGVSFTLQDFIQALDHYHFHSQRPNKKSTGEELLEKELPLKFEEMDEEQSKLILSNRKAVADSQPQLRIGSVVVGSVKSLKPYGAIIDIGGINGLLHVSQISHDRVMDIESVLQPGDILKVMILSHDRERGRISLSTKKLEPTHGDMIRNPKLVFEKAEDMAQAFRQRVADMEAMARANMLNSSPSVD